MHLVIVGGNGFIGSHFVAAAVAKGHRVTVVGHNSVPSVRHDYPFEFVPGGIHALAEAPSLLQRADRICHFATSTTPASSNADPVADVEDNLVGTIKLLEAMRQSGNRRILFLSSGGAVYGHPRYVPIDEAHPINPLSSYGVVKAAVENYLRMYEANYDFRATIIRPANPYGPGQSTTGQLGAVNTFIRLSQTGQPATLWGDGSVTRDFVYIADVVALLLAATESEATGTFNCGAGVGTSLIDLIGIVERATGRTLERQLQPARAFDPPEVVLDISSARQAFNWRPQVSIEAGVTMTIGGRT